MGLRDAEEMLEVCKAQSVILERLLTARAAKLSSIRSRLDALDAEAQNYDGGLVDGITETTDAIREILDEPGDPIGAVITPDEAEVLGMVLADAAGRAEVQQWNRQRDVAIDFDALVRRLFAAKSVAQATPKHATDDQVA